MSPADRRSTAKAGVSRSILLSLFRPEPVNTEQSIPSSPSSLRHKLEALPQHHQCAACFGHHISVKRIKLSLTALPLCAPTPAAGFDERKPLCLFPSAVRLTASPTCGFFPSQVVNPQAALSYTSLTGMSWETGRYPVTKMMSDHPALRTGKKSQLLST